MEQKEIRRENWIDATKVIAISIVILNHSGIVIPGVNFWGGMFFVPAFFLLAGYTYLPKDETYGCFVKRKAKRLLIPYFVANFLIFGCSIVKDLLLGNFALNKTLLSLLGIFYGRNQLFMNVDWEQNIYFMKILNAPTWFLPALFLTLISGEAICRKVEGKRNKLIVIMLILFAVLPLFHIMIPVLLPWSLDSLPCFLIFFLLGYILKDAAWFEKQSGQPMMKRLATVLWLLALLIASGLINGSVNLSIRYYGKNCLLCVVAATTSSILLMYAMYFIERKCTKVTEVISKPAKYTLSILCYHYFIGQTFSTLMMLVFWGKWGNNPLWWTVSLVAIILSVVGSIVLECLFQMIKRGKKTRVR
ncbi:MAG: acyltransferase [Lachnospiraceae bacterium]|nr:acyltransferase [Lachnospiraceae bacterium]